ncbi:MAG: GNVR domain-containing protein [Thermodesulfobacteriota bacterium]|nr:GNVR domain-containing protein [Thermodesulfobacteriota bacterium]
MKEDITILYYINLIKRRKNTILIIFFVGVSLILCKSFISPKIYKARLTILPIEPRGSASGLSSFSSSLSESSLPIMGNITSLLPSDSNKDKLINILESRVLKEAIINKLGLLKVFFHSRWDKKNKEWIPSFFHKDPPVMEDALIYIKSNDIVNISENKKGLIYVDVYYKDSKIASDIANAFASELDEYLNKNTLSMAKKNRIFIEKQVNNVKQDLRKAEEKLKNYEEKYNVLDIDIQTEQSVKAAAELEAEIRKKEVKLNVFKKLGTSSSPAVLELEDEISELKRQVIALNRGIEKKAIFTPFSKVPEISLAYLRLKRENLVLESVYEFLTQQYETAKIEEAREEISFQVLDHAVPPKYKTKPNIIINLAIAIIIFSTIGFFVALFKDFLEELKAKK